MVYCLVLFEAYLVGCGYLFVIWVGLCLGTGLFLYGFRWVCCLVVVLYMVLVVLYMLLGGLIYVFGVDWRGDFTLPVCFRGVVGMFVSLVVSRWFSIWLVAFVVFCVV